MSLIDEIQPLKVKGYGWRPDRPDHRDLLFDKVKPGTSLPSEFDMWADGPMPPIYDQGQLGSCTGNGWARVMEKMQMEQGEGAATPSRLFIYYYERLMAGYPIDQDTGAEIRDGAKVVAKYGAPPETDWPYDISKFSDKPPVQATTDASKRLALQYKRVIVGVPGAPMRSAVAQGCPIVFGFPVPDYFEGDWDPTSEPLPLPGSNPNWIGGHCVTVTGYDFTRSTYDVPVFLCDNSWGESWGMSGRFAIDYRWFSQETVAAELQLANDLWIVEKVS